MSGWHDFFFAEVGASATLAGLVFVGVSINLQKIVEHPRLPKRALEGLLVLVVVLVSSSLGLVPDQPPELVGAELLLVGLVGWVMASRLHLERLHEVSWRYRRQAAIEAVFGQGAMFPFIVAGAATMTWGYSGLYCLVPGVVFSFLVAFFSAWILLVEIKR